MLRGVLARPHLTTPLLRVRNLSVETQTTRESSYSSGVGSPVESLVWTVDTRERWVVVSEISSSGECWGRGKNWEFVVRCEGGVRVGKCPISSSGYERKLPTDAKCSGTSYHPANNSRSLHCSGDGETEYREVDVCVAIGILDCSTRGWGIQDVLMRTPIRLEGPGYDRALRNITTPCDLHIRLFALA
ncbi:hypothetical protein GEV33_011554 [Tenebrio molitor]|uniref:Uncharacterized protein n=1 Tax=Tenebrio molitor TaxID=7067 RepID=A0A8J6L4Y3_TENMO|nr:hypothetical protein GEV33_011554 [Tenebrio molitor]